MVALIITNMTAWLGKIKPWHGGARPAVNNFLILGVDKWRFLCYLITRMKDEYKRKITLEKAKIWGIQQELMRKVRKAKKEEKALDN